MKELIIAESAGFCFGVQRSVDMAHEILNEKGKLKSLGELVHNNDVIKKLSSEGMTVVNSVDEIFCGDEVIIRAHGISKKVQDSLESKCVSITDATCPKVMSIHKIVKRASHN